MLGDPGSYSRVYLRLNVRDIPHCMKAGEANLANEAISNFATIDIRKDHPAITALNRPTHFFTSSQLAEIAVPNPSDTVRESVGSASVAEAAAILSSRSIGSLISPKRKFRAVTVAVAQRATKLGRLFVVGLGPGNPDLRTYQAAKIISHAEVVTGFGDRKHDFWTSFGG